ncbi:DUF262 domain-containing protein [Planomonospora sp. ID82291]|uniref:DUF262 domain-containing protein n=1 Tax=Planomonospora sp. ID82291 TaxID=2738136 RepID=UPI0018C3BFFF|nr:DUF262 domain-containing protein [Planomonospora sp. ID82291]MBG0814639.1 DUF262 domain-containing protein [Planomonospora sp. ID82291]
MPAGAASVTPRSITVGALLEEHHPFWVPRYQRAYSWDSQVSDFTGDVAELLQNSSPNAHFFGGLVCIEHTDHSLSRPHSYEIIDGQQRLATFVLALAQITHAARNLKQLAEDRGDDPAKAVAETLADDTESRFLKWRHAIVSEGRIEGRPRLRLSKVDDPVFQSLVDGSKPSASRESHELLIAANKIIFDDIIKPILEDSGSVTEKAQQLYRVRTGLIEQSHVIQVVSSDRERAYQLFSVLNDRGRSLEDADLLRSHTLDLLQEHPAEQEKVAVLWDEILSATTKDTSAFFKAYFPSTTGKRAGAPMFKKLVDQYFAPQAPNESPAVVDIVEQVESFQREMITFTKLANGEWPFGNQLSVGETPKVFNWHEDRLKRLILTLKHELALPLLLAAASSCKEEEFAKLVFMIEKFAFRYKSVCGGHATSASNIYYKEAKILREQASIRTRQTWSRLRDQLNKLLDYAAPSEKFRDDLQNKLQYSRGSQKPNIRELLTTIEDHHGWIQKGCSGPPVPDMTYVVDLNHVTIEHIYPQKPAASDRDTDLDKYVDYLGNLSFFGPKDNSDAGNKNFPAKSKDFYSPSRINMTRHLSSYTQWTLAEFKQRHTWILDMACKIFVL